MQKRNNDLELYQEYLSVATQCQSHIASIADKGSLPERYLLLLEELRLEAVRHKRPEQSLPSQPSVGTTGSVAETIFPQIETGMSAAADSNSAIAMEDISQIMPDDSAEYGGWDQFADLVSSGLGNLDAFLEDDLFKGLGE